MNGTPIQLRCQCGRMCRRGETQCGMCAAFEAQRNCFERAEAEIDELGHERDKLKTKAARDEAEIDELAEINEAVRETAGRFQRLARHRREWLTVAWSAFIVATVIAAAGWAR